MPTITGSAATATPNPSARLRVWGTRKKAADNPVNATAQAKARPCPRSGPTQPRPSPSMRRLAWCMARPYARITEAAPNPIATGSRRDPAMRYQAPLTSAGNIATKTRSSRW